ncbi:hypothetical protein A0256_04085 [Mucilaginibacter sp. PAMC 26640]|nr:hypothetical protein A0256_04085 [Mucilaginibacter sp. PAMC 26640]
MVEGGMDNLAKVLSKIATAACCCCAGISVSAFNNTEKKLTKIADFLNPQDKYSRLYYNY